MVRYHACTTNPGRRLPDRLGDGSAITKSWVDFATRWPW